MDRKAHKFGAILRALVFLALFSVVIAVVIVRSCMHHSVRRPSSSPSTGPSTSSRLRETSAGTAGLATHDRLSKKQQDNSAIQYNEKLSAALASAWQRDFVAVDDLNLVSVQELKDMTATIKEMRELITDAQLESLDPALEQFFITYGTKEKLIPQIAFQNLLPKIPAGKPEAFKKQAEQFIQENIMLFEIAFDKCKQWFEGQNKKP